MKMVGLPARTLYNYSQLIVGQAQSHKLLPEALMSEEYFWQLRLHELSEIFIRWFTQHGNETL